MSMLHLHLLLLTDLEWSEMVIVKRRGFAIGKIKGVHFNTTVE